MTLDELKKRATAAELTLIEATEAATRKAVTGDLVRTAIIEFCERNPPPGRRDSIEDPGAPGQWLMKLREHLNTEKP